MGIKDCDYLSQKIAIFYHGRNRHSSIFGGFLSIFLVFVIGAYILYSLLNIYYHKSSNYISYKTHVKESGYFTFSKNESSIFHFFQFLNIENNQFTEFNTKYVRIFMTHIKNGYKNNYENLNENEHWVYDKCRKGIDDKNIPETVLNNKSNFEGGACLRYYYNHTNNKYYSIDDEDNFIYPYLSQEISSNEFLYLNTIVEKCHNDSILHDVFGPCETEYEINNYFNNITDVYMQLLERTIEAEDYYNPIFYYLNNIPGSIEDNSISINNLYIAPFEIEIKNGYIYSTTKKTKTYILNENKKEIWKNINNNKYILTVFNYWLINTAQIIQGEYKSLMDVLSNVGGYIQCLYTIFFGINFISNKFKIMQDSKNLFFQITNNKASNKAQKEKSRFGFMSQLFKKIIYNNPVIRSSLGYSKTRNMTEQFKNEIKNKITTDNDSDIKILNKVKTNNKNTHYNKISAHSLLNLDFFRNKTANLEKNNFKLNDETNNISGSPLIDSNNINHKNDILKNENYNRNFSMDDKKLKNEIKKEFNGKIIDKNPKKKNKVHFSQNFMDKSCEVKNYSKFAQKFENIIDNSPEKKNYMYFSQHLNKFINEKRQKIKIPDLSRRYLKIYTSFYHFILSIVCPKSKRGKVFYIINKFRKKLVSEEHLFNTQIFLYYLGKYFDINESEKIDFMELYNYL